MLFEAKEDLHDSAINMINALNEHQGLDWRYKKYKIYLNNEKIDEYFFSVKTYEKADISEDKIVHDWLWEIFRRAKK